MTQSTGQRPFKRKATTAYRNRAVFRNYSPVEGIEVDAAIVEACVELWRDCAKRANSRYGGTVKGNHKGRSAALRSPDDVLREHGILFAKDPKEWAAYERAIRLAAVSRYAIKPRRGRKPADAHEEGYA